MFWRICLWFAAGAWVVMAWTSDGSAAEHAQIMAAVFLVGAILSDTLKELHGERHD